MNPAWVAAICALATLVLAVLGWLTRYAWRGIVRIDQFLEDWNGRPSDNRGHEERPGVMERLIHLEGSHSRLEESHQRLESSVADVQAQVHLNTGHSMRDEIQLISTRQQQLSNKVDQVVTELRAKG